MEVWQRIMDFTEINASKVQENQWNLNYLEIVGTSLDCGPKFDDICKRIPKLRIETRTTYVKPRVESKLAANFRYTPPKRTTLARKPFTSRKVSVKVVIPKEDSRILQRNCHCTCKGVITNGEEVGCNFDNDITLDKLLEIIKRYEQENLHGKAICNIADGFEGNITLDEDTVTKILMMLDSSDSFVQETVLLIIHRLSKVFVNAKQFLHHGGLDDLIYLMLMGSTEHVQIQAANCIAKLTEREELAMLWMQTMVISGTEALFDVLASEDVMSEDLRNAALKAIANISTNEKMATRLLDFGLEKVVQLICCQTEKYEPTTSPMAQRLVIKVLTNVISHNCSMVEQFLGKYEEAMEGILKILQYAECPQQQEAARFLATMTLFKPSIDTIISYNATQHLIWAMTCSHCRIVREYTSKAFKNVSLCNDKDKTLDALSQLSMPRDSQSDNDSLNTESMVSEILSKSSEQDNMAKFINTVKGQTSCSSLEKTMVEVFSVVCVCFQTDSLHRSGKTRTFRNGLDTGQKRHDNSTDENYLSSLTVLCNVLAAIEKLICLRDEEEAGSAESGHSGNLKLAFLYVQCGGLQFIEQLSFISTKLQTVNLPSFHSIDPTILPPKELISTLKTSRKELIFQQNKPQNKTFKYPDFGFHPFEIQFLQQALSLLVVLGEAISPDYDPALEDLNIFSYKRQVVGRKKTSFRASALMVQSVLKLGKLSPQISAIEEKPVSSKRKPSSAVRKSSQRPTIRNKSPDTTKNGSSKGIVTTPPLLQLEPGTSTNCEMVQFVKQSILNSKVVSHLACWITCGVYDIQMNVLKVLRYLMHISEVKNQPTDTQTPSNDPQEAWAPKRTTSQLSLTVQRSPFTSGAVKSKTKLSHLGYLCVRHVIQYCGPYLLDLLKPPAKGGLGRMSLMVIHGCISNGEHDSHVKLVKLGCFAQIIECIRGTEDEADTQSLCLVVLRKLVSSDQSLKQLFFAHGGMSLVMALHEYKNGVVKEQAALTLTALSKGSTFAKTKGLTKKRHKKTPSADDIWDHVSHKWEGQDKVSKLLRTFNVRY